MKALSLGLAVILGSLIPQSVPAGEITTREGKTYHEAELQRVEPDGIILSYQPPGGGLGNAKLKFAVLPENMQLAFGYDPQKAAAFEMDQIKAQGLLQRKLWSEYGEATNRVALRRIEEEKQAEIEARENAALQAQKDWDEQERIAKESRIKAGNDANKHPYDIPPDQKNNPYYLPDELTVVTYAWSPAGGFVPLQYQPPVNGMYRPPIPQDQVPTNPERTTAADPNPSPSGNGVMKNGAAPGIVTISKLAPVSFP